MIEMDRFAKLRTIAQEFAHASVIGFEKSFQNQAPKQLRQCEFVGTKPARISR
jgi:hypothetical protein